LSFDEWDRPNLRSGSTEPVAYLLVDGPDETNRRLFIDALWGIVAKGECAAVPPTGAPGQYVAVEEWDRWLREHRDWAAGFARKYSRGNNGYWSDFFKRYPEWARVEQ
jgi:hypothetical protein